VATLDLTWAQRQHRLSAIQRVDLGFLVNRQHQCVIRRVQIEPNHIDHLVGEMRIVADFKGFQAMGFEVGSRPDLPNLPRSDPGIFGHQANAPVSGLLGDAVGRQRENFVEFVRPKLEWLTAARQILQPFNSSFQIALSPLEYRRPCDLQLVADGLGRHSISPLTY
jgi:hypothetical protein